MLHSYFIYWCPVLLHLLIGKEIEVIWNNGSLEKRGSWQKALDICGAFSIDWIHLEYVQIPCFLYWFMMEITYYFGQDFALVYIQDVVLQLKNLNSMARTLGNSLILSWALWLNVLGLCHLGPDDLGISAAFFLVSGRPLSWIAGIFVSDVHFYIIVNLDKWLLLHPKRRSWALPFQTFN